MKKITLTYDEWCKECKAAGDSDGMSRCPVCRKGMLFGINGDFNQAFMKCTNGDCGVTHVVVQNPEIVWFKVNKEQRKQYYKHSIIKEPLCNFCGKQLDYNKIKRRCLSCGSPIRKKTPIAKEGHPFPHNHRPLRTCHQDLG